METLLARTALAYKESQLTDDTYDAVLNLTEELQDDEGGGGGGTAKLTEAQEEEFMVRNYL